MHTDPTTPRVLLRSEHSDGRVSVTESVMPPGAKGPPLHVHDFDARFLIVCTPAGFEREFARRAAARAGTEPPDWALQSVPRVTRVGPPIAERAEG